MSKLPQIAITSALLLSSIGVLALDSGDAYIRCSDTTWVLGTATVERTVALQDGRFILKSFKSKATGRELVPAGMCSNEFFVSIDENSSLNGASGKWRLIKARESKLKQGELQLDVTLQRDSLQVTKSYVIYPKSSLMTRCQGAQETAPIRKYY